MGYDIMREEREIWRFEMLICKEVMVLVMKLFFDIGVVLWIGGVYIDVGKGELREISGVEEGG